MVRRCCFLMFVAGLCLLTSCQRASQYPALDKKAAPKASAPTDEDAKDLHRLSWLEPAATNDLPIVFVAESSAEWKQLPSTWNHFPPLPAHLGLPPMQALAAVVLSEHHRVIQIKVPRGLPDPTPNIPATNRPTYGKWRLGKDLFFTPFLKVGATTYACSTCHEPRRGFAGDPGNLAAGKVNTLSLINVAFNRRQFWDGRVPTLEETLFQSADDERLRADEKRLERGQEHHVWAGFARALKKEGRHDQQFRDIFGIEQPTQDAVAQALATYLRTLLSGDSVYDRAEQARRDRGGKTLAAADFAAVLKDETTAGLLRETFGSDTPKREEMPALLAKGDELFHRKRCAECHAGPLFTDNDFHNIGLPGEENWPVSSKETGRAIRVPIGLKEGRLIGAFRTPRLRNLAVRSTFFHDGSKRSLREVVEFYDSRVIAAPHLAKALKDDDRPRRLGLEPAEIDALVIFLRSLQGQPLEPSVMAP